MTVSFISAGLEAVSGTGVWGFTVLFLNDVPRRYIYTCIGISLHPKTLNPENPTTVSFISAGLEAVSGTGVWRFTVLFLNDVPRRVTII